MPRRTDPTQVGQADDGDAVECTCTKCGRPGFVVVRGRKVGPHHVSVRRVVDGELDESREGFFIERADLPVQRRVSRAKTAPPAVQGEADVDPLRR